MSSLLLTAELRARSTYTSACAEVTYEWCLDIKPGAGQAYIHDYSGRNFMPEHCFCTCVMHKYTAQQILLLMFCKYESGGRGRTRTCTPLGVDQMRLPIVPRALEETKLVCYYAKEDSLIVGLT